MILELENVNSFYGQSHILFDMSFNVGEGEIVSVLGRNGVGKSTTLKSIIGLLNPKERAKVTGSIKFDGVELVGMPSFRIAREHIAYVPQGRRIFPTCTVRENLLIADRKGYNGSHIWTLDKVYGLFPRLKEREHSQGRNLSGGEQQMLAIARGLMQNPRLLLLDESTEGLAPAVVNELSDILKELQKEGITLLLVEQNIRFALSCCTRCYIMEKGSIVYSSPDKNIPKDILAQYLGV